MSSLPPELQLLILESSSPTQYPTLRLVSVFWKSKIDILKSLLYRAPPLITKPYKDWCTELIPSSAPFLIHSALFNCTGFFHRTIDPKTKKIVLSGTKRPRKKYEIPSGLLENTQEFILYKNEPLIIPDTSTEYGLKPVERTIRLQYLMNRNCGASSTYQVLVQQGDVIGKEKGMTLGEFEEWIRRFRAKKSLLMVPGEEGEKFVIQVGVESKSGVLTIHIEDLNRHR